MTDKIPWTKKINPCWWIKNDDSPRPPSWYRPAENERKRETLWFIRNPFHNLTWYVLGVADREFKSIGRAPGKVFVDGWNYTYLAVKKFHFWLSVAIIALMFGFEKYPAFTSIPLLVFCLWMLRPYPFVSYRSDKIKFYI